MFYLYILKSLVKNVYYIGTTGNLQRRLLEHSSGKSTYTRSILPIRLVGYKLYDIMSEARWNERLLKRSAWKRKEFIKALESSSLSESIDS